MARRSNSRAVRVVAIDPLAAEVAADLRWRVKINAVICRDAAFFAGETAVVVVVWGGHISRIRGVWQVVKE